MLFLGPPRTAMQQARTITRESAGYNIGFTRVLDALTLPLGVLSQRGVSNFRFSLSNQGLAFEEKGAPSLVRDKQNGPEHEMFLHGLLSLDAGTGRVLAASLTAANPTFQMSVDVRYAEDPNMRLLVPVEMQERYRQTAKPKEDRLEVASSYSMFRRFRVTTEERMLTREELPVNHFLLKGIRFPR